MMMCPSKLIFLQVPEVGSASSFGCGKSAEKHDAVQDAVDGTEKRQRVKAEERLGC
jgi:hypothetical protein